MYRECERVSVETIFGEVPLFPVYSVELYIDSMNKAEILKLFKKRKKRFVGYCMRSFLFAIQIICIEKKQYLAKLRI